MSLKPGILLGSYEILSQLGAGGMGEVYKARDTRLDRIVAIKVMPEYLADRPDLRERSEREARTIASLNHSHICTLYDIGSQDGADFLVMEYLQGETLAERLKKGPLPLDQALEYAIEIADALDKAHRQGITHRDLKPGNIMLTKSGTKLLDFGLAKLQQEAQPNVPNSQLPTIQGSLTAQGTILGTLQYMAPEQVEGKTEEIDARTDIFSFGAVMYEMVTGKKVFEGGTSASVMSKILQVDPPPMSSFQPMIPSALDRVVKTCLAKEPDERWQAAADLCRELQWIKEAGPQAGMAAPGAAQGKSRRVLWWAAGGLILGAVIAGLVFWTLPPVPPQPVSRLTIDLPPGQHLAGLDQPAIAISPDGKNIVYVAVQSNPAAPDQVAPATHAANTAANATGTQQLYLRPLDSNESKPIAGTEGAAGPFFSPDSQWIGFFADGKLKKVSVSGGAVITLANAPNPGGASWSSAGTLALQTSIREGGLQQVSQEGGALQPLNKTATGEGVRRWPEFLPGGQAVLFASTPAYTAWNDAQIAVRPLGEGGRKNLVQGSQPRYAASGHLLYGQRGTLMAVPFDARRLALAGAAVPVIQSVIQSNATGAVQYSISSTGTLVYLAGGVGASQSRMVWVSRDGEEQPLPAAPHTYQFPRVSPDGHRVAVGIAEKEVQVWIYDTSRDALTRLTFGGNVDNVPAWSPDGKRIAFNSNWAGPTNLFWQASDGSGVAERLTASDYADSPNSFSPDGQLLAYIENVPETGRSIWVLNLKDRKAQSFLKTTYEATAPKFSPDGKWLAYTSDESGHRQIYVQPYPGPGGKWQISTAGGQEPVWNPKGGELFYRTGSKMMVVDVDTKSGFSAGKPRMLFEGPYLPSNATLPYYDVSPDGQRFLMLKPVESGASAPTQINVVLNWFEELKQKVPVK